MSQYKDLFYFYPDELIGFIESCVLSTQRREPLANRRDSIYSDIRDARVNWSKREEDSSYGCKFSLANIIGEGGIEEYEIDEAYFQGCYIDKVITELMSDVYDAHGAFAIGADAFHWMGSTTLSIKVIY